MSDAAGQDAWERVDRVFTWLLTGTLLVATAVVLSDPGSAGRRTPVLLVAVVLLAWHALLADRAILRGDDRIGWPQLAYWAVLGPGTVLLAGWGDAYSALLYGVFPMLLSTLGWWGLPGVALVTAGATWRMDTWAHPAAGIVNVLVSTALAALVGMAIHIIARQSQQRREALAALAATRAELAEVAHRTGALEERERLAREIHDTVAQDLISVITHLQAAEGSLAVPRSGAEGAQAGDAGRHVRAAADAARSGLSEVRRAVRALRPDLLEGGGLVEALERLCAGWTTRTGVLATLTTAGASELRLHPDVEVALLRAAQEALSNVARHAAATSVEVHLAVADGRVRLRVVDDGVGLQQPVGAVEASALAPAGAGAGAAGGRAAGGPAAAAGGGFGLRAMAERVEAVGGTVDLGSGPTGGTAVTVEVPA